MEPAAAEAFSPQRLSESKAADIGKAGLALVEHWVPGLNDVIGVKHAFVLPNGDAVVPIAYVTAAPEQREGYHRDEHYRCSLVVRSKGGQVYRLRVWPQEEGEARPTCHNAVAIGFLPEGDAPPLIILQIHYPGRMFDGNGQTIYSHDPKTGRYDVDVELTEYILGTAEGSLSIAGTKKMLRERPGK